MIDIISIRHIMCLNHLRGKSKYLPWCATAGMRDGGGEGGGGDGAGGVGGVRVPSGTFSCSIGML